MSRSASAWSRSAAPATATSRRGPNVSRRHAEVRRIGEGYSLVDLGSTNGTDVNGQRIQETALMNGDVIELGTTRSRSSGALVEPLLLVLKVAFVVLLYLFIWRSSGSPHGPPGGQESMVLTAVKPNDRGARSDGSAGRGAPS